MSEDYQAPSGAGHPITPPPELVQQLRREAPHNIRDTSFTRELHLIAAAYRAGADQELDACCEWLNFYAASSEARDLRAARRPKPPSLAVKALAEIQEVEGAMYSADLGCDFTATRRALERLQELEGNG